MATRFCFGHAFVAGAGRFRPPVGGRATQKQPRENDTPVRRSAGILPCECVRRGPGFSVGPPAWSKRRCPSWQHPLRGLIVLVLPPRGPEEQRAFCAQKQRQEQSRAEAARGVQGFVRHPGAGRDPVAITLVQAIPSLDSGLRWNDERVGMRFRGMPQFPDTARCGRITGRVAVSGSEILDTACS